MYLEERLPETMRADAPAAPLEPWTRGHLAAWLAQQTGPYDWGCPLCCPFSRYAQAQGVPAMQSVGSARLTAYTVANERFADRELIHTVAATAPWTFEAAHERLMQMGSV